MKRNIVHIDQAKCNGCGQCISACAEGALALVNGKARLVKEIYCDGLGACLGTCPQGAITIEQREAEAFDGEATRTHLGSGDTYRSPSAAAEGASGTCPRAPGAACPGAAMRTFERQAARQDAAAGVPSSQLGHWPVQLRLVPAFAPFLKNADLLVCADCVAFAVPDFHERYVAGRAVLVGCPKLDDLAYYREKLESIFAEARPRRITVLRMEVPCCGGIANAAVAARNAAAPDVPLEIHTVGIRGGIVTETVRS